MGGSRGKLTAAARWLYTDPAAAATQHRERTDALRKLGVPAEQLAAMAADVPPDEGPPLRLWRWHHDALLLMQGMRTQWRAHPVPAGVLRSGLDYAALDTVARWLGVAPSRGTFWALDAMARAARELLNERDLG